MFVSIVVNGRDVYDQAGRVTSFRSTFPRIDGRYPPPVQQTQHGEIPTSTLEEMEPQIYPPNLVGGDSLSDDVTTPQLRCLVAPQLRCYFLVLPAH